MGIHLGLDGSEPGKVVAIHTLQRRIRQCVVRIERSLTDGLASVDCNVGELLRTFFQGRVEDGVGFGGGPRKVKVDRQIPSIADWRVGRRSTVGEQIREERFNVVGNKERAVVGEFISPEL